MAAERTERTDWTVESASKWLKSLLDAEPEERLLNEERRHAYLSACSVLAQFPISGLRTADGEIPEEDLTQNMRDDLVKLPRARNLRALWTLKPGSRSEGLRRLGTLPRMWSARQWNRPPEPNVLQEVFDEFLQRDHSAAKSADPERLDAALQVHEWLSEFDPSLPLAAAIERERVLRRLLQPMEHLTRGFMGRNHELAELRDFVGVLEPENAVERIVRFFREVQLTRQPPMMLHGIGGIGKSTLLAEFIRQHVNSPVPFPWAYLDFDNPRLNVSALSTLIAEMVEQLRAQYPGSEWDDVLGQAEQLFTYAGVATTGAGGGSESNTILLSNLEEGEKLRSEAAATLAVSFVRRLRHAMESSQLEKMMRVSEYLPFLLVLDTFEEVQKRGVQRARVLWTFLSALAAQFPRLRVIISGRAPVPEAMINGQSPKPLLLKEFDERSALSFLLRRDVKDEDVARALVKQVGGNPLNLKLAAQVAKREDTGRKGIEGLRTTSFFVFAASERVVQGQLYQRILDRISNPHLQRLAHPGLVVRRVTAGIIQHVLAVPCGLGEIDETHADYLFSELGKQVDLVIREQDGALRHQQDVRRVMLKDLETERPEQVREIHRRAFEYYLLRTEPVEQIEKIYHALQLGKDETEIRAMWNPDAAESLLSSIDEFPPVSQLIVHLCSDGEAGAELRSLADLDQWERVVEPKAREALEYGDYKTAMSLVRERADRTAGSALYAIEAVCATALGDYEEARGHLDRGIQSASQVHRIDRLVELFRLRGELLRRMARYDQADGSLTEAQTLAMRIASPVIALQIYADRARLQRGGGPPIEELNEIVRQTGDADFASSRLRVIGLFRICGPRSIPLLLKGLRIFKLRELPSIPDVQWPDEIYDMVQSGRLNDFLQYLLESDPENASYRRAIAEILEIALDPNMAARST